MRSRSWSQLGSGRPLNALAMSSQVCHRFCETGTSRAASRPDTVISISSPPSTRRTSSDACCRNSRNPTVFTPYGSTCATARGPWARDHHGIEDIAVVDAWLGDDDPFCVVHTPPWSDIVAGTRRQRDDLDPVVQLAPYLGEDRSDAFAMPSDPESYGSMLLDDISQPLGAMSERLRFDSNGVGWWGTLGPPSTSTTDLEFKRPCPCRGRCGSADVSRWPLRASSEPDC